MTFRKTKHKVYFSRDKTTILVRVINGHGNRAYVLGNLLCLYTKQQFANKHTEFGVKIPLKTKYILYNYETVIEEAKKLLVKEML